MMVKVCGLNNAKNLLEICQLPIDMVGYNFYKPSLRYVDHLLPEIPKHIAKVGVFVNESVQNIQNKVREYALDFVQLHGDETPEFVSEIQASVPVIKVFRISDTFDSDIIKYFSFCEYFLFDTATKNFGGSGKKFNWDYLLDLDINVPFLLSGGIGPKDMASILQFQHPLYKGLDINSKFEISAGEKDVKLVEMFVTEYKH